MKRELECCSVPLIMFINNHYYYVSNHELDCLTMQRNADLGSVLILILILIFIRIGTKICSKRPHILGQIAQLSIIIFLFATITGTCQRISKSNLRIKPNYVHLITKPKIRLPPKFKSILSHLWLCDLISRSGDVHPNPGPRQAGPPIYPCGTCQRPVKNRDKAILCDDCTLWHHISCVGISTSTYHSLVNQTALWFCKHCGIPNFTPSFSSDEHSISHTDSYEHNNAILYDHDNEHQIFGPNPQNASTPERQKRTQGNSLKGILINTNSVKSIEKATQLKATIHYSNPDIIFLVETKLDSNYQTYSFLPPNYEAIRKDRNAHGGGVLIAFRDDITAESLDNLNSNCEIVWTKIHFARNKSIFFASYYRPPSDHLASLEALQASLTKLYRSQKNTPNVVIAGDFNLPDIDWNSQQTTNTRTASKHNKLLEIISEFGLQNMVNDPTRIESGNILDLILTSNPSIITNTHTTPGMSDHEAVTFEVNLNPIRNRKPPHKVFKYKSADWCKLKNEISKMTDEYFDTDPNSQDVNTNWTFFRDNLTTLMNNTIPHCNTKAKSHLPWISRELIRMQRRRNKSHKKAKQTGLNKHWEQFRELRRQTTKALATSYKSYVNHQIGDSLKTNPKRFWSFIKANKRENIGIPTLRVNDKPITNDRDKANALNNQFSSVFTNERYPIPVIDHSLYSSMPHLDIGINGIIKQLKNLNQNKATGPDELPARVLKETAEQIAPIITHIFQQSYNTGKLPNDWLQALVTPIHKKSLKSDPANYRPISLTCILCKVMEHIIVSNIWKHLHKHDIILHFQHGFQSGLSCESQLIETVHDWMTALDNRTQIDAILLDFAKAFDKVPHKRLLSKLTSYGITGNTNNWITSFLSNRKQRVSVNGALSDITDVTSGVPQGSVLGPILFLLYINDINENVQSSIRLFADDSIIYRKINSNIDHQILQTDLAELEKWSDKINGKCSLIYQNVCTFRSQTKLNQAHTSIHYFDTRFLK